MPLPAPCVPAFLLCLYPEASLSVSVSGMEVHAKPAGTRWPPCSRLAHGTVHQHQRGPVGQCSQAPEALDLTHACHTQLIPRASLLSMRTGA